MILMVAAVVNAAVSSVTVYGDRARVVRTAEVSVEGSARIELPLLSPRVDESSVRLEASGAQVRQIELQRIDRSELPVDEARALLERIDKLDDEYLGVLDQRRQLEQHLLGLSALRPRIDDEPLRPRPRLNARHWDQVFAFTLAQREAAQERIRKLGARAVEVARERQPLIERAHKLESRSLTGVRVTAALEGHGTARLKLSYLVYGATWVPGYDLQLEPDQKSVRVAFSGTASQETGEDWDGVRMTLSTALPATVRALPEIATWKIGEKERFIPTPHRANRPPPPKPPPAPLPVSARKESEESRLRQALAGREAPPALPVLPPGETGEEGVEGGVVGGAVDSMAAGSRPSRAEPKPAPPPPPKTVANKQAASSGIASIGDYYQQMPEGQQAAEAVVGGRMRRKDLGPAHPDDQVGLVPPTGWRPPDLPPGSPASMAGGFDLQFASMGRETVHSGEGARRVLLFSEIWPVSTERLIEPAVSPDAYLVAQLKNPSERTLPRGQAALSVGADPSGSAVLPLVAPGQELTLPLGIDHAVKSFRNVAQVQTEKGLFSKDEVTRYQVTIEVQNPYPAPIPLRIVDQVPLAGDKNVEVELIEAGGAEHDKDKGTLTFRAQAPAAGSLKVAFVYQLKRPKGYRVHQ